MLPVPAGYTGYELFFRTMLNTAVKMMAYILGIQPSPRACPSLWTHAQPHLDEYAAALMVRATHFVSPCHVDPLRGITCEDELFSPESHPALYSSRRPLLLGIGGSAKDAGGLQGVTVWDEHANGGQKTHCSVLNLALDELGLDVGRLNGIGALIEEVSILDLVGQREKCAGPHLGQVIKDLGYTQCDYGGGVRPIYELHIEAVVAICIACAARYLADAKKLPADATALTLEWYDFAATQRSPDKKVREIVLGKETHRKGTHWLALVTLAEAVRDYYPEGRKMVWWTIFTALTQSQASFHRTRLRIRAGRNFVSDMINGIRVLRYQRQPDEQLPHRALLNRLNSAGEAGVVIVYDDRHKSTHIGCNSLLDRWVWRSFVEALMVAEPKCWYSPDVESCNFVLNRNPAHHEIPRTALSEGAILLALTEASAGHEQAGVAA